MAAGDLPDELAGLLPRIQRLARRRLWSGMGAPRLRGAHAELLRLVAAEPGIRVSTAAHSLCLAANSVSTLVNHLVAEGLLRREKDPGDGRAALLYPTSAGVGKLRDWRARREALFREHLARLGPDDRAALAAALPALRGLADSLREGDPLREGDEIA
ncbi:MULTISPECIES: MarR family winged helix-turn-helix transcriptional regulator [unclassified Streptomyces]|uniref:MarR family winged helix-turn-helix transcriptional regulator n=1 Tax=unclassified Streptomyces TaxID=2593676 RepID=UPI002253DB75|nr:MULTISPECIES: MarR family transcriptional regulator [unclassified Streptomyces]WSP56678.1 MarR family transcriptional regulator [Streptomyces sp. NBC_01241]WSU22604.1 MarR family transcriptional regulator [Streptomyces sp. NBC_01108]MCX4788426.1 MarR family transcriptional regulator [Streptomyces sp. NBC_01221]MCX4795813.1 MarR family transcriptional regulator [Streptomyces sp. NBC_01242]WSJ37096.1 MarR family transcriptional regulator [Streptomyces sp. NBC_01321]